MDLPYPLNDTAAGRAMRRTQRKAANRDGMASMLKARREGLSEARADRTPVAAMTGAPAAPLSLGPKSGAKYHKGYYSTRDFKRRPFQYKVG